MTSPERFSTIRVTIGLPVYNGERYLAEALDTMLAQTFGNFEIIISDNASTDNTRFICEHYAAIDNRVRYIRNEINMGAAYNFNRLVELASGVYFKWLAHDDRYEPTFLEKCVAALDSHPEMVLAHTHTMLIDAHGQFLRQYSRVFKTDALHPSERFLALIIHDHFCFQIFGVMRTGVLRQTPLIGNYAGADRVLLARLGLMGGFHQTPEYLFLRRTHSEQITALPSRFLYLHTAWYDPQKKGRIVFPEWRILREYYRALTEVELNSHERWLCHLHLMRWVKKYWVKLGLDVMRGIGHIALSPLKRIQTAERLEQNLRRTSL